MIKSILFCHRQGMVSGNTSFCGNIALAQYLLQQLKKQISKKVKHVAMHSTALNKAPAYTYPRNNFAEGADALYVGKSNHHAL